MHLKSFHTVYDILVEQGNWDEAAKVVRQGIERSLRLLRSCGAASFSEEFFTALQSSEDPSSEVWISSSARETIQKELNSGWIDITKSTRRRLLSHYIRHAKQFLTEYEQALLHSDKTVNVPPNTTDQDSPKISGESEPTE